MPVKRCQKCNYVIVTPSIPCSSCGSMYVEPTIQPFGSSEFSVGVILSRSFSTLLKHPFVFLGLNFLAQIPAFAVLFSEQNLLIGNRLAAAVCAVFFGLFIQGAVANGVYEVLRGNAARFGGSLFNGLSHIISMVAAILLFFAFLTLIVLAGIIPISLIVAWLIDSLGKLAILALALVFIFIFIPMLLIQLCLMIWQYSKWCMFVPACAAERLGPIESLSRSTELTKSLRSEILAPYLLVVTVTFIFIYVFWLVMEMVELNPIFYDMLMLLAFVGPMAFFNVLTAVIYFELRSVKEGVSAEYLAHVFD